MRLMGYGVWCILGSMDVYQKLSLSSKVVLLAAVQPVLHSFQPWTPTRHDTGQYWSRLGEPWKFAVACVRMWMYT